jgi:two-component system response regulator RpfG
MEATLAYLYAQRGRLFDPRCVDALVRGREALQQICDRFSTASVRPGL